MDKNNFRQGALFYFKLQFKIMVRHIRDAGVSPLLLIPVLLLISLIATFVLLNEVKYGTSIFAGFGFLSTLGLSKRKRLQFLQFTFLENDFIKIRIIEHLVANTYFVIFLLGNEAWMHATGLLCFAIALPLIKNKTSIQLPPLSHPFKKYDFEWIIAFRSYTWLLSLVFSMGYFMGLLHDNFTLSLVSATLSFLTWSLPYSMHTIEPPFFVWIYNRSSSQFIKQKLSRMILYSTFFMLPFLFLIGLHPSNYLAVIFCWVICLFIITGSLLIKYTAYPNDFSIQIQQGLFISIAIGSLFMPYLALVMIALWIRYLIKSKPFIQNLLNVSH